ncbi:hypothetical protein [Deinococcus peraridilitoris]|uniref:Uncharacterized protein n=1 Tax=Deinococcus peraridilitoris (strain DSM 19664 / LMG 22246 / CIP 109416 / KR-200) TaxID=937777 RepID=L0A2A2_DEIPD|nr:hypothetical protein [Deinococcus peraridilitoris]AFZ67110.1 hypothetical protein Deipe_1569 [Deinococcus peraridilitoris DSM 19664]
MNRLYDFVRSGVLTLKPSFQAPVIQQDQQHRGHTVKGLSELYGSFTEHFISANGRRQYTTGGQLNLEVSLNLVKVKSKVPLLEVRQQRVLFDGQVGVPGSRVLEIHCRSLSTGTPGTA